LKVNEAVEAKEMDVEMNDVCMNNQIDQDDHTNQQIQDVR